MVKKPDSSRGTRKYTTSNQNKAGQQTLNSVIEELLHEKGVTSAKMFGSQGLKVNSKVFFMLVNDRVVVKLPRARVVALVESGKGEFFDPGHGRIMKEWIALDLDSKRFWKILAREALVYVTKLTLTQT